MSIDDDDGDAAAAAAEASSSQQQRAFTVLYGTQTGNAHDVATRIARQARRRRIQVAVKSMDEYDVTDLISESLVIFVLSTTGQGDFPPAALRFWHFLLRADLPTDILSDVTFSTFGLGDSSYKRYCWPVRKLHRRLAGLGAQALLPSGEADDQHFLGIDGALQPWLAQLWSIMDEVMPIEGSDDDEVDKAVIPDDVLLEPEIAVSVAAEAAEQKAIIRSKAAVAQSPPPLPLGWQWATLVKNERMTTSDHFQDVRFLSIQGDPGQIDYHAGDVVSLQPTNLPEDVERFLTRMRWMDIADAPLRFHPHPPLSLPPGCPSFSTTVRHLATHVLDILSVPRQSFFEAILPFAQAGSLQREKLQEYVTPGEGADDMYEYAQRVRRTILEVLEEFGEVDIPLKYVLDVFPLMRPRDFSIASAPNQTRDELQLAVAIVKYKTRLQAPRRGVLTHYLAHLSAPTRIPIQLKRGTFRLPLPSQKSLSSSSSSSSSSCSSPPCIFIGPGTGIAPMRALLQTRLAQSATADDEETLSKVSRDSSGAAAAAAAAAREDVLFAGCRFEGKDFLFGSELRSLASDGHFGQLVLAASRDPPRTEDSSSSSGDGGGGGTSSSKYYVQDAIRAKGKLIRRLVLQRGAWVFVSGSSGKMPEAVRAAFVHVLAHAAPVGDEKGPEEGGGGGGEKWRMSEEEAEEYVSKMEREGRWQEECWS